MVIVGVRFWGTELVQFVLPISSKMEQGDDAIPERNTRANRGKEPHVRKLDREGQTPKGVSAAHF